MKYNIPDLPTLVGLLNEAKEWVTDKPWDDPTYLHKRICEALNQPIEYPNWNYYNEGEEDCS